MEWVIILVIMTICICQRHTIHFRSLALAGFELRSTFWKGNMPSQDVVYLRTNPASLFMSYKACIHVVSHYTFASWWLTRVLCFTKADYYKIHLLSPAQLTGTVHCIFGSIKDICSWSTSPVKDTVGEEEDMAAGIGNRQKNSLLSFPRGLRQEA